MEDIFLILTALSVHIFAWLTPGPIFVLIVRNSLIYSRKTGLWTAVGISLGNITHITYSLTGLALIISSSPLAFNTIKYIGVTYLIYLGLKTLLTPSKVKNVDKETQTVPDLTSWQALKTGFLTNILSPKASLFFMSIFATVMTSEPPYWVLIALFILMPLNSLMIASIYSVIFTQKHMVALYGKYQKYINWLLGSSLLVLALSISFK